MSQERSQHSPTPRKVWRWNYEARVWTLVESGKEYEIIHAVLWKRKAIWHGRLTTVLTREDLPPKKGIEDAKRQAEKLLEERSRVSYVPTSISTSVSASLPNSASRDSFHRSRE